MHNQADQGLVVGIKPEPASFSSRYAKRTPALPRRSQTHSPCKSAAFVQQPVLPTTRDGRKAAGWQMKQVCLRRSQFQARSGGIERVIGQIDVIGHAVDHVDIRMASRKMHDACDRVGIIRMSSEFSSR